MFSRAVTTFYFLLSLALLAAAMPGGTPPPPTTTITATALPPTPTGDLCSTGSLQCCQSIGGADNPVIGLILGLLGIVIDGVDVLLGLQCSPIKIVGLGDDPACAANVVCCENNSIGGLISIGCIAIIL
ncbi:fungal hydrophobin-domain-containing protein [Trametes gibbosa]|nr:fungal hydrophobin-domain-containing protein [Trametes gibbosa]